ncbi:DEAD/DEAH box helicase family protein [Mesorhizobium sp. M0138]|uniref:DEAD/DEAH box helicase family protein n=1 Tax=Mesorhizobium sp. M0138 TaxID=2956891 RepID=UPI00333B395A
MSTAIPSPLPDLAKVFCVDTDAGQELKEAVCDALVNLTAAKVSGEGAFGETVVGQKPSDQFVSGFLLNQLDAAGEDETSDIRIAVQGVSIRLRTGSGTVRVEPSFAVYVRVLPTWEDLNDEVRPIRPKARLRPDVRREVTEEARAITGRLVEEGDPRRRSLIANEVIRRVLEGRGVRFLTGGQQLLAPKPPSEEDSGDEKVAGPKLAVTDTVEEADMPDSLCVSEEIPPKFLRLRLDLPALEFPIAADAEARATALHGHANAMARTIEDSYAAFIASDIGKRDVWRKTLVPPSNFRSKENWEMALMEIRKKAPSMTDLWPKQKPEITVEWASDLLDPTFVHVAIALLHRSADSENRDLDGGLFQVGMAVTTPSAALVPYVLERVKPSYDIHGFQDVAGTGWNAGVIGRVSGTETIVSTTWAPRYVLPRIVARDVKSLEITYKALSTPDQDVDNLRLLPIAFASWIDDFVLAKIDPLAGVQNSDAATCRREQDRYDKDIAEYRKEISELKAGIALLDESCKAWKADPTSEAAIPFKAWFLTNRTFLRAAERRGADSSKAGWRLFQVAFVLANLISPATRMKKFEHFYGPNEASIEAAALLYFATGGGKSEAFYGLLVFTLFLDRLRGKHRGISALIRYPLRLLTSQQARRLARVLAEAELIRRDERIGGAPLEIGFWVGGSSTPNKITSSGKLEEKFECVPAIGSALHRDEKANRKNAAYDGLWRDYNKLPQCPFCNEATAVRRFPSEEERLGIVCLEGRCRWNKANGGAERPLPFVFVDEDIYRIAPPILLGTVDKLALIGQHWSTINKVAGMFGVARFTDKNDLFSMPYVDLAKLPPGLEEVYPAFRTGTRKFFDPVPSLIVQDEAHLLEESLGTFAGLFETTLYQWFQSLSVFAGDDMAYIPNAPTSIRLPKVVAATATISDPVRQIEVLYQKRARQFPHKGPRLYRSFYAEPLRFVGSAVDRNAAADVSPNAKDIETFAPWARVYVSLLTNGCPHTTGSVTVLGVFTAVITVLLRGLLSGDPVREAKATTLLRSHVSGGPLRARHDMVLSAAAPNVLASAVDLHRVALTYVTNKKGGDQILSALPGIADRQHRDFGREAVVEHVITRLISGGVESGLIEAVVQDAERRLDLNASDAVGESLRMIVATSAVSHGVDVDNFNSMFFAGMPTAIDEYIQASSRVGRAHVGFSMLIPTPQNRRDRFVLEVHESFHRFLERMIAPPAVERWTDKAVVRAIPSLIQNWLLGVRYQDEYIKDGAKKQVSRIPRDITAVRVIKASMGESKFIDTLKDYILACIGTNRPIGGAVAQVDHFTALVLKSVRDFSRLVDHPMASGPLDRFWKTMGWDNPMTSLRDVDLPGTIEPYLGSGKSRDNAIQKFRTAMRFIRDGGQSN